MEGATGKPIVVPRLNMAMTAQRLSISTFNGGDSISERLHDEEDHSWAAIMQAQTSIRTQDITQLTDQDMYQSLVC